MTRAEEKRRQHERVDAQKKREFMRDLPLVESRAGLVRIANKPMNQLAPGYRYYSWLGCALHGNPYDKAPGDVREAIEAALARTRGT